jgi:protein subunit release factor A
MREHLLRVTIKDCEVQTFSSGGPGGQNQNRRSTGVRIIHRPSGAVGEARDERSQWQNKRSAFRRMAESVKFRIWIASFLRDGIPPSSSTERIRTYNFVDHYVKDHRTGTRITDVTAVLNGDLDLLL